MHKPTHKKACTNNTELATLYTRNKKKDGIGDRGDLNLTSTA